MIGSVLAHIAEGLIRPRASLERLLAARPTTADAVLMVIAAYAVQRVASILLAPDMPAVGFAGHAISLVLAIGYTFLVGMLIHRIGAGFGGRATAEQGLVAAAWHALVMSLLWPVVVLGLGDMDIATTAAELAPSAFLALAVYFATWVWLLARFAATIHGFASDWAVVGVIMGVSVLLSALLLAVAGG